MKIIFISRKSEKCGVADYGKRLFSILQPAMDITMQQIEHEGTFYVPEVYDIALVNYHHATLPWPITVLSGRTRLVGILHEGPVNQYFDQIIPVAELPRPITFNYYSSVIDRDIPWIGTFGFGFPDKNYLGIAKLIRKHFAKAKFRMHVPFADFGDATGDMALTRVLECKAELEGSNIELEAECRFMEPNNLIAWLNQNDMNVFNCIPSHGRGISSSIDYALAAYRPIAVSGSEMYRHLPKDICLDNFTLPEILAKGLEPLKQVYADNSNEALIAAVKTKLGI